MAEEDFIDDKDFYLTLPQIRFSSQPEKALELSVISDDDEEILTFIQDDDDFQHLKTACDIDSNDSLDKINLPVSNISEQPPANDGKLHIPIIITGCDGSYVDPVTPTSQVMDASPINKNSMIIY